MSLAKGKRKDPRCNSQMAPLVANSSAAELCVHPFDPSSARCGRNEWIRKVLSSPRNLVDGIPQFLLLLEAHPVSLIPSFDQDTEEGEKNCMFSGVGGSANGLIVKSRDSRPMFR